MTLGLRTACTAIVTWTISLAAVSTLAQAAGPGDKGGDIGSPPIYSDPFAGQPLDLGEAAPAQIGATFALAAPGFVGDFFGGASGSSSTFILGRAGIRVRDLFGTLQQGSPNRLTASAQSGTFTFTSEQTQAQLFPLFAAAIADDSNVQNIKIEDNAAARFVAESSFVSGIGNVGTTTFDRDASRADSTFAFFGSNGGPPNSEIGAEFDAVWFYDYVVTLNLPSPSSGGVVGRQKLVENSSPIPRDRLFFNYSLFQNVRFTPGGIDVSRFVPGFEKTFWDQQISLELRAPFASTLNSDLVLGSQTNGTNTEFGNLTLYGKALLLTGERFALGAGLGVAIPTADDITVRTADGTPLVQIQNDAVHLLPYVGGVYAPNDQFYAQAILQFDVDANGNSAHVTDFQNGLTRVGSLNDTTWCFASFNMGYWLYRAPVSQRLSGVAPLFEVHYNKTLQRSDAVQAGPIRLGEPFENIEMINLVAGANFELFGTSYVSLAYIAPVTGGNDRFFDGEFRALFNRYF